MILRAHEMRATPRHPPRRSFTLVEVLAAVVLLALITTGLTSLIHSHRATRASLRTLPEIDRTRMALVDSLQDPTRTKDPARIFESTFLAHPQEGQSTPTHSYVWMVHSSDGVSAAVLVPRHAFESPGRGRGATSHRSAP